MVGQSGWYKAQLPLGLKQKKEDDDNYHKYSHKLADLYRRCFNPFKPEVKLEWCLQSCICMQYFHLSLCPCYLLLFMHIDEAFSLHMIVPGLMAN
jgi:hypothetical protein